MLVDEQVRASCSSLLPVLPGLLQTKKSECKVIDRTGGDGFPCHHSAVNGKFPALSNYLEDRYIRIVLLESFKYNPNELKFPLNGAKPV